MFVARNKAEQNEAVVDPWTAVHLGSGVAAGLIGAPFFISLGAALAYEWVETKGDIESKIFGMSKPETRANQGADIAVFVAGYMAGRAWNRT